MSEQDNDSYEGSDGDDDEGDQDGGGGGIPTSLNASGLFLPENPNALDPFDERFYPGGEFDADEDIYENESQQEVLHCDNRQIPRM